MKRSGTTMIGGSAISLVAAAVGWAPVQVEAHMPVLVLEEIIVTARRRAESLQDVPISMAVVSGHTIRDATLTDLQQLSLQVPNFQMAKSTQAVNQRLLIRGVGSVGDNAIESSVAVYIDGVYYPRPGSVVGSLMDIERVEVLKGPQGTLYGRNASMGALNISTRKPDRQFNAEFGASYGSHRARRLHGAIGGGLAEGVAGRVAFSDLDRDGYGSNSLDGDDIGGWRDRTLRGALRFQPSGQLDITLGADWQRIRHGGPVVEVLPGSVIPAYVQTLERVLSPDLPVPPLLGGGMRPGSLPEIGKPYDYRVNQVHSDNAEDGQWGMSAHIDWRFGNGYTLRSISAYRDWDSDTVEDVARLPLDLLRRVSGYDSTTLSQEFHLMSPADASFTWMAGAYYYREDYTLDQAFDLGADFCAQGVRNLVYLSTLQAQLAHTDPMSADATAQSTALGAVAACAAGPQTDAVDAHFHQDVKSRAVFAQGNWSVDERLELTGGVRISWDDKSGLFLNRVGNVAVGPGMLDLRAPESTALAFRDRQLTWLAGASYSLAPDTMLFATWSNGYKAGGFNAESTRFVSGRQRIYDSERVDNIELGIKSAWEQRVSAHLTAYRTTIDDFQDRQFNGLDFIVKNAGRLRQQGLELDISARPAAALLLQFSAAYLDSEFQRFAQASPLPGYAAQQPWQDLKGKRNSFSPQWQASLAAQWSGRVLRTGLEWFARADYHWTDEQNINAQTDNNTQAIQEAYGLLNARLGLRDMRGRWELAGWVRNVADRAYCQTIYYQPLGAELGLVDPVTGGGMARCVLGEPRTVGVDWVYRFGPL